MLDWSLREFDVDGAFDSESFGDDISTGRVERFFFREKSLEDLFGYPGMVCGERVNDSVSNEVEPAVSDMGNGEHILVQQCGNDGGPHPGIVRSAP